MNNILNENYKKNNIIFDGAKKDFLYSKGKKYIDLSYGSGTLILGHGSNIQLKIFTKKSDYINIIEDEKLPIYKRIKTNKIRCNINYFFIRYKKICWINN